MLEYPALADQLPPFAKATSPQLPSNLIVVEPGQTSNPIKLPTGECWIWAAPKAGREYKAWSWHRYGPFKLTDEKPYVTTFTGDLTPKQDTEAAVDLKKNEAVVSFKNPLPLVCGFVVESGSSVIDRQEEKRSAALAKFKTSVLGVWQMSSNGDATFSVNGTVRNTGGDRGIWKMLDQRTVRISWKSGWYNTCVLAPDGSSMTGFGSHDKNAKDGQDVWGKRKELP